VFLYSEELEAVLAGDGVTAGGPVPHDRQYTDFPAQLSAIGEHLLTLPGPTRVLAGHGEETTVSAVSKQFDSWVTAGPRPLPADPD
jgi:glyoxylase-like metal-dependent hydrolase (beta-lactamase superfamily II)